MAIARRPPRASDAPLEGQSEEPQVHAVGTAPHAAPQHPPGQIRIGTPFFATALALFLSLNYVLLCVVPHGWVLELVVRTTVDTTGIPK